MIAPSFNRKFDATALLRPLEPSQQVRSREVCPNDRTEPIQDRAPFNRWGGDSLQSEFDLPSTTGDFKGDLPEVPVTESSSAQANRKHTESNVFQSIRVLHNYSIRVQKIVNATAYVHLSEDDGAEFYAQRKVDDFGGLCVQEGDLLALRVYIEDNELRYTFERLSNSIDQEAYAAFCRDIADINPE
jgi:hypothetical protein